MAVSVETVALTRTFPSNVRALDELTLRVEPGQSLGILGPSGSGKTTLLRLIAGLDQPTHGDVRFDEHSVRHVPPWRRGVALLGQTPALFPHLSVRANLGLALKRSNWSASRRRQRIDSLADELGIAPLLNRRPAELSGGERQRVAIGRALAPGRKLMLLDEPFVSLDTPLRHELRAQLARIQRQERFTLILVTHDRSDAFALSDRIAVLSHGRLAQIGTPEQLHAHPATLDVARLTSDPPLNFLPSALLNPTQRPAPVDNRLAAISPDAIRLIHDYTAPCPIHDDTAPCPSTYRLAATSLRAEFQGSRRWLHVTIGPTDLRLALAPGQDVLPGQPVQVALDPQSIRWFDARTGQSLTPDPEPAP